jgi:hypothetical protein
VKEVLFKLTKEAERQNDEGSASNDMKLLKSAVRSKVSTDVKYCARLGAMKASKALRSLSDVARRDGIIIDRKVKVPSARSSATSAAVPHPSAAASSSGGVGLACLTQNWETVDLVQEEWGDLPLKKFSTIGIDYVKEPSGVLPVNADNINLSLAMSWAERAKGPYGVLFRGRAPLVVKELAAAVYPVSLEGRTLVDINVLVKSGGRTCS